MEEVMTKEIGGLKHEFVKENLFCPFCGKQTVWVDENDEDYYVGYLYYCSNCDDTFFLP